MSLAELDLNELVLTWVVVYGSPMVAGVLFLGALGIPMPGTLLVIASGAFIRQGFMDIYTTPLLGLSGVLGGDMIIYGLGRFARSRIQNRFGQSPAWQNAEAYFRQRGGLAIYLTRWLFTPIAIPVNLIAGSSGYPFLKFLVYDVAGEITWILLYGGLGYAFGNQWELLSEFISDFSGLLAGILGLAVGIYLLFRRRQPATETTAVSLS